MFTHEVRGQRREAILRAARTLFVEHGVRGTSMRTLAQEVGVTEGALYRHFRSKDEIVDELFAREATRFHAALERALRGEGYPAGGDAAPPRSAIARERSEDRVAGAPGGSPAGQPATTGGPAGERGVDPGIPGDPPAGGPEPWRGLDLLVEAFVTYGRDHGESFQLIMILHQTPGVRPASPGRLPRHLFQEVLTSIAAREQRRIPAVPAVVVMIAGLLSRLVTDERAGRLSDDRPATLALARRCVRGLVNAALEEPSG